MTGSSSCINQSPPDLAASGSQLLTDVQGMSTLIMVWPGGYVLRKISLHARMHTHTHTSTHTLTNGLVSGHSHSVHINVSPGEAFVVY